MANKILNISNIKSSLTEDLCVDGGYGEYIVYKRNSDMSQPSVLDQKTYEKCYQVLLRAKQIPIDSKKQEMLKRELAQIDPTLEIFFIPRTLYELCFIQKCVKETLRLKDTCSNAKFGRIDVSKPKCWHGAFFTDFGNDQDQIIIDLAYRLNQSIVKNLRPENPGALSYKQITSIANEKLTFLMLCHESSRSTLSIELAGIGGCNDFEITYNLIVDSEKGASKPIGIETDKMKDLVLNAIALECSNIAKGKFILYRGANISADKPLEYDETGNVTLVQSLSYGTGVFPGGMYDPGATAFYYLRKADNNGFAILVPQEEAENSPFAIPTTHPLCQMFGRGEKWHARSRTPTIDINPKIKVGCRFGQKFGEVGSVPPCFQLAVNPQQFEEKFQYYMKNSVVNLKS
jgi:hypothetical protein